jgi:DNA-binding NtrC family response regulator
MDPKFVKGNMAIVNQSSSTDRLDSLAESCYPEITFSWAQSLQVFETISGALKAIPHSDYKVLLVEGGALAAQLELLQHVQQASPGTAVVFVVHQADMDSAVQLIRAGAKDYIHGPMNQLILKDLLTQGPEGYVPLKHSKLFFPPHCPSSINFVGRSQGFLQLLETVRIIANSRCNPILITGATGTGKELAAKAVHQFRHKPSSHFVAVNCATLTATLLESELFGHVKGAFTGADREKVGLLEMAQGGSIFLDEISEMALDLQAKLLRVLQERVFRKVGGTTDIRCDATIIASSNRNLLEEVQKGCFRQDLYYRLAVFPIVLSELASPQRCQDITILANYFIATSTICQNTKPLRLSEAAKAKLQAHSWPGNVRELKNVIERALIISIECEEISAANIILDTQTVQVSTPVMPEDFSLESAERELIIRALREANGQRTRAANLLGITRATLHAKIKRYDISSTAPLRSVGNLNDLPV